MFMYQEILRDQYPYDVDGWGHLVNTLASNNLRQCEFSVFDAYNPDRGFLLPYIFALSYCVFGFVESVQVFNVLFHAMSCFIVVFFISNKVNSLILTSSSVLLWSVWPAYSYLHGYYFSEQIGALLILVVAVLMLKSDKSLKYFALTGLILALLLHVR
ncbi:MAG: hypothetical protein NWQ54_17680, partial [Paraglaciecola sp.]|nr:hypothetical protein [Paraglaciecola sp.]